MRSSVERAGEVTFNEPQISLVSNVSGEAIAADELCTPEYWVRHARQTVRFADSVLWLRSRGVGSFLELGPDSVLSSMVEDCLASVNEGRGGPAPEMASGATCEHAGIATGDGHTHAPVAIPVLRRKHQETQTLLSGLSRLWVRGVEIDWSAVFDSSGAERVALPTYVFQRERYWPDAPERGASDPASLGQTPTDHPLLGAGVALADEKGWVFTGRVSLQTNAWLADHLVMGSALLPGTAFLEGSRCTRRCRLGCRCVSELDFADSALRPARTGEGDGCR